MKPIIFIVLVVLTFSVNTPEAHALFSHVQAEKERRHQVEEQLVQEQQHNTELLHSNRHLHVVISLLSATAVGTLLMGAVVGSKTRKDHDARS